MEYHTHTELFVFLFYLFPLFNHVINLLLTMIIYLFTVWFLNRRPFVASLFFHIFDVCIDIRFQAIYIKLPSSGMILCLFV